ncbi:MAG: hypothetical protein ABH863_05305, partial [Candidatus Micrarchaeota archaeon]
MRTLTIWKSTIFVGIILLVAIFVYLSYIQPQREPAFMGERLQMIAAEGQCKSTCESEAKTTCFSLYQICMDGGAGGLLACSEYAKNNPQIFEKYRCTYMLG